MWIGGKKALYSAMQTSILLLLLLYNNQNCLTLQAQRRLPIGR